MTTEVLEVAKDKVLNAYKGGTSTDQALIKVLFGDRFLKSVMERINSFEDACAETGRDPLTTLPYPDPKNPEEEALNAVKMAWVIVEAANEGWVPDFTDENQTKYTPYFVWKEGVGFVCGDYYGWNRTTDVGSRLCFRSTELAEHFGKKFIEIYRKFL
jgi:hypothetical protein